MYDGLWTESWPFGCPLHLNLCLLDLSRLKNWLHSSFTESKTTQLDILFFSPQTWNMHHWANQYYLNEKEESKVIFISCLVPCTAQIDLPCYVSDQITRKPALTSAFGISRCAASHALVQNSMHKSGFLLWVSLRCTVYCAQMHALIKGEEFVAPLAAMRELLLFVKLGKMI